MHPVLLSLGPVTLYSYGTLSMLGAALAFAFVYRGRASLGIVKREHFWLLVNVILIGGIVGSRIVNQLLYVPFDAPDYWSRLFYGPQGLSAQGGFVSAVAGIYLVCRGTGIAFLPFMDRFCAVLPLWHAFGRLGCLAAGCCHGKPTNAAWAVTYSDPRALVPPGLMGRPLHPTQLYEAVPEAFLSVLLCWLVVRRPLDAARRPGLIMAGYLSFYCVLRFITEFFRADAVPLPGVGLSSAQGMCILMFAGAAAIGFSALRGTRPYASDPG